MKNVNGIAITERQFHHLEALVMNPEVESILIFPLSGKPEKTISNLNKVIQKL